MKYNKITDLNIAGKVMFIRTDMNVPIIDGIISDYTRIDAGIKTIDYAIKNGAKVIIATHLGRPDELSMNDIIKIDDSVKIICESLSQKLQKKIKLVSGVPEKLTFGDYDIVMLENVRCNFGEKANSPILGKKYANLCDIFVHDAFASAHRKEASTDSIGDFCSQICAGLQMIDEIESISKALENPDKPIVAIVAGSKVSTKLNILKNLSLKVDYLIVAGGILNTFLLAAHKKVGKSLVEVALVESAQDIMTLMRSQGKSVLLPLTVVTSKHFNNDEPAYEKNINDLEDDDMILDIGNSFSDEIDKIISIANTIIWNGPVGVFEFDKFSNGTKRLGQSIAKSNAYSLAGGGDTISAINKFGLTKNISYISTAGGALLEYLEGKDLPAFSLLKRKYK